MSADSLRRPRLTWLDGGAHLVEKMKRHVVASGIDCGLLHLLQGEVLNSRGLKRVIGVAEFGAIQLGGCRPCGQYRRLRVSQVNEA